MGSLRAYFSTYTRGTKQDGFSGHFFFRIFDSFVVALFDLVHGMEATFDRL